MNRLRRAIDIPPGGSGGTALATAEKGRSRFGQTARNRQRHQSKKLLGVGQRLTFSLVKSTYLSSCELGTLPGGS
jgi:hypothetical protein